MSVVGNLTLNSLSMAVYKAVLMINRIVLVPFYLSAWGAGIYGDWLTLTAVASVFALSNLGMGSAASNAFVVRYAQGEYEGSAQAISSGRFMLNLLVLFALFLGGGAILLLRKLGIFQDMEVGQDVAALVVMMMLMSCMINFHAYLQHSWFRAARKMHYAMIIQTSGILVRILLTVVILWFGGGMAWVVGMNVSTNIVELFITRRIGESLLPNISALKIKPCPMEMKAFFLKGVAFMGEPLRLAISLQGVIFIIRALLGAEFVALFGTLRTLGNCFAQLYISFQNSIFPEFQYAYWNGNKGLAKTLFIFALLGAIAVGVVGGCLLLVGGEWFYLHWTASELSAPEKIWFVMSLWLLVGALWLPSEMVMRAVNIPETVARAGLVSCALVALASYVFVEGLGVMGAFIGLLVGDVIMLCVLMPKACLKLGVRLSDVIIATTRIKEVAIGGLKKLSLRAFG